MYTTFSKSKVALLACLMAIAFAGVASAYATKGGNCSSCHTSPGGAMTTTTTPNPLDVALSAHGLLSFNVSNLAAGTTSAICVQFGNATLFNNVSSGVGSSILWTKRTSSGNGLTSNTFTSTGTYVLDLAVGAAAPTGSFPLTLWLSGSDGNGTEITTQYSTTLNVTAIPEPATLGLFLLGTVGTLFRRGRRA